MKKINYIIFFLPFFVLLVACKKDTLLTYNAPNSIYFQFTHILNLQDSTDVSFAYSPASVTDTTIMVPVFVTGTPAATDREYTVKVDPSSTVKAGSQYVLPTSFVLPAGSLIDSFPVKLLRTPDMQDTTLTLLLDLEPGKDFNTNIKNFAALDTINALSFKITVSDIMVPGPYWTSVFAVYFGDFSVKKVRLLNQVTGMPLNYPTIVGLYDLNLNAHAAYYAISMSRYLDDQATAGNTVYEADGITPMVMGASYQ